MHFFAYIDPGSGALIWQSVVGIFVGVLFYMRRTRKWLGGLMCKVLRTGQKPGHSIVDIPKDKHKVEADHL
jgi:hypothetical protein